MYGSLRRMCQVLVLAKILETVAKHTVRSLSAGPCKTIHPVQQAFKTSHGCPWRRLCQLKLPARRSRNGGWHRSPVSCPGHTENLSILHNCRRAAYVRQKHRPEEAGSQEGCSLELQAIAMASDSNCKQIP